MNRNIIRTFLLETVTLSLLVGFTNGAEAQVASLGTTSLVTGITLDFGDLYRSNMDGAANYNAGVIRTFEFKNLGGPTLTWNFDLTTAPSATVFYATGTGWLDATSGQLPSNFFTRGQVSLNPAAAGTLNESITIQTNGGNLTVNLQATVHDTDVHLVVPALGSNGKVNMGENETLTFEIELGNPSFPNATIKGYQWQAQFSGVVSSAWRPVVPSTDLTKDFSCSSSGARTIYARMVDSNDVGTDPVEIPVEVLSLPTVSSTPPTGSSTIGSSWFTDEYVGVVNQPITLQATSDLEPTLTDGSVVTLTNGSTFTLTTDSRVGSGVGDFDGIDDFVEADAPDAWQGDTSFTVLFWMNFEMPTTSRMWVMDIGTRGTNTDVHWLIKPSGNAEFGFWADAAQNKFDISSYAGQWVFVATVYDNTTGTLTTYLYDLVRLQQRRSPSLTGRLRYG